MGGFEAIADTLETIMNWATGSPKLRRGRPLTRSRLDHVSRADPTQLLGPPGALGADGAVVQPLSYFGLLVYAGRPGAACALVAPAKWIAGVYLLAYLILRFALAWTVGIWAWGRKSCDGRFGLVPLRARSTS